MNHALPQKLAAWISTLSPGCKQVARLQSQAVARPLSVSERMGLELHLLICHWCRRFGEQVTFLRSAAHQCSENEQANAVYSLTVEGRERIKQRLSSRRRKEADTDQQS